MGSVQHISGLNERIRELEIQLDIAQGKAKKSEERVMIALDAKSLMCDALGDAQREQDVLLALLRKYQWSARRGKHGTQRCCPCCLNFEKDGDHSSDCDIGNALKENE